MPDKSLRLDSVWYDFSGRSVLRDVTLAVSLGERVALAGPNGSGKTTLLSLLAGERRPTRGQSSLDGRPISGIGRRELARAVAVLPQHLDAGVTFPVHRMVAMGRTPYVGLWGALGQEDRTTIGAAMEATDTQDLADRRFDELSGGEQQRVMLAMALAQNTRYLLLDEPTVHLDLHHQHGLFTILSRLHTERQLGILAVLHDLNLAALFFDRLIVLEEGQVVAQGEAANVVAGKDLQSTFNVPLSGVMHPVDDVPQVLLRRDA